MSVRSFQNDAVSWRGLEIHQRGTQFCRCGHLGWVAQPTAGGREMFDRDVDYPTAVASYDTAGVRDAIAWCTGHMEKGDTLTVWTSLKSNLRNSKTLEQFVNQHSDVEHVTGRGGAFLSGPGPVLMAWGDMDDIGELVRNGGSYIRALCVITWNERRLRPWVTAVRPQVLGDGSAWEDLRANRRHPWAQPPLVPGDDAQRADVAPAIANQLADVVHVAPGHQHRARPAQERATSPGDVLDIAVLADELLQGLAVAEVGLQAGPHRQRVALLHVPGTPGDGVTHSGGVVTGDGRRVVNVSVEHLSSPYCWLGNPPEVTTPTELGPPLMDLKAP